MGDRTVPLDKLRNALQLANDLTEHLLQRCVARVAVKRLLQAQEELVRQQA